MGDDPPSRDPVIKRTNHDWSINKFDLGLTAVGKSYFVCYIRGILGLKYSEFTMPLYKLMFLGVVL